MSFPSKRILSSFALALALVPSAACDSGSDDGSTGADGETGAESTTTESEAESGEAESGEASTTETGDSTTGADTVDLVPTFEGLGALGDGFVYEGWLIVDDAPVTTGRFTVDETGALDPAVWPVAATDAETATAFVLTIEPDMGDDPAPSDVHVVAGDWSATGADLSIDHGAALGTDFADAAGEYILETPTSMAMDDADQGIWFLIPGATDMSPGLTLPELPAGWAYEGWVVGDGGPVSTGTFTAVDAADADGGGPTAGPDGAPPFPGQDFIDPAMSLLGNAVVISVEPVPDDSPAPFAIKPLMDPDAEDIAAPTTQSLNLVIDMNTVSGSVAVQ